MVTRTNHLLTINYDMCLCYMRNSKFPRWNIKFIVKCENVFHSCGCFVLEFGLMLLLLLLGVALTHMAFNSFMCIICERCDAVYLCGKEICLRERRRFVSRSNRNSIRALKSLFGCCQVYVCKCIVSEKGHSYKLNNNLICFAVDWFLCIK